MMTLDIDTDELLRVIQGALDNTDTKLVGFTRRELGDLMGWSDYKTLRVIHMLGKRGLIKGIYAKRRNFHGVESARPAYELVKNKLTIEEVDDNM
jgi:hypothetical protein